MVDHELRIYVCMYVYEVCLQFHCNFIVITMNLQISTIKLQWFYNETTIQIQHNLVILL